MDGREVAIQPQAVPEAVTDWTGQESVVVREVGSGEVCIGPDDRVNGNIIRDIVVRSTKVLQHRTIVDYPSTKQAEAPLMILPKVGGYISIEVTCVTRLEAVPLAQMGV